MTRRGCSPRRCGSWMTCGSSGACPGGALILPAAARYRNITAALPEGARRDGQGAFDLFSTTEGSA